ncbi:MAG: FecR domain-containing protein [Chitinophagaceae bacterium]|nr:FecR domain-containing protein [Chitinophagaceae bacterium]
MDQILFHRLLNNYLLETITEEETRQFFALLDEPPYQALLKAYIEKDLNTGIFGEMEDPAVAARIKERLLQRRREPEAPLLSRKEKTVWMRYRKIAAAAAVLLVLLTSAGVWINRQRSGHPIAARPATRKINDIPPGRNGAILTLANGAVINLDSTGNGGLGQQGNTKIIKTDGLLSYKRDEAGREDHTQTAVLYNTITVPPAHQWQLLLPDGSAVWLNASSSLRFPTVFTGGKREVELTGEGYFEITHKDGQPFVVKVGGHEVQDIGTRFNIMAYTDERTIRTTLIEGAVKVVSDGRSALLRPHEQADITGEGISVRQNADIEEALAWKNGLFLLNGADLPSVLRQIGRWYDVEIVYMGSVPQGHMTADIPRTMNLSSVMELFRQFGISCELQGKKLIISG